MRFSLQILPREHLRTRQWLITMATAAWTFIFVYTAIIWVSTFTAVSAEAGVNEPGAGMSACWLDYDNDGQPDIYAAGMWVASFMRIFEQPQFQAQEAENIRALYQRHMLGNSLYRNLGNGRFQNDAKQAGVEMGRWSWSTDAWDFDHDGYPDLYIANGYISGSGD